MTVEYPERPPDWNRWPREARMAYLSMNHSRLELVEQLLEAVGREPDPNRDE